jgi:hypothetical protein
LGLNPVFFLQQFGIPILFLGGFFEVLVSRRLGMLVEPSSKDCTPVSKSGKKLVVISVPSSDYQTKENVPFWLFLINRLWKRIAFRAFAAFFSLAVLGESAALSS